MSIEARDPLQRLILHTARLAEKGGYAVGADNVALGLLRAQLIQTFNNDNPITVTETDGQCVNYSGEQIPYSLPIHMFSVGLPILLVGIGLHIARRRGLLHKISSPDPINATIIRTNELNPG